MYLFLFLPVSTAKINEHYVSNKHKKTLEGGEKEADYVDTQKLRDNVVLSFLGFLSASYILDLEWN